MKITAKAWNNYIKKLSSVSQKAADLMEEYVKKHGIDNRKALIDYAYAVANHYGSASGALACEMYEAIAEADGAAISTAEIAELPDYGEIAKTVNGTLKYSQGSLPSSIARLVKRASSDTTLKNAERDGAQFAWVPRGDTCAFCLTLASRGWQYVSKKTLKNGHAEHIHGNCDCEYAVRFNDGTNVAGYEPDVYKEMYDNALDRGTPKDRINAMRRIQYTQHKDRINSQKRAAYAIKKDIELLGKFDKMIVTGGRIVDLFSDEAEEFADKYYGLVRKMKTDVSKIAKNMGYQEEDIQKIKNYLFLDKNRYDEDTGRMEYFHSDCAIAHSWQRMLLDDKIKPHDRTLIEHELLEMSIKEKNPGIDHLKAHELASEKYNYQKEVDEYYGNLKKHKK